MKRTLIILVLALAVLWGGWYLYSTKEQKSLSVPEQTEFFKVDVDAFDSTQFKYADWTYLGKDNGRWMVHEPSYSYPADTALLSKLLRTTNGMVLENVISTNPSKFERFQVDTTTGRIMRFFGGGQPMAAFVIGKVGPGATHTYVRQISSDTVYLARGRFQDMYTMMPDQWKSPIIVDRDSSQVDTIRWIYPDREVRLARGADGIWTVWKSGMSSPMPTDSTAVTAKLGLVCPLRTHTFLPDGSPDAPTFDTLGLQMIMVGKDGIADTVVWNKIPEESGRVFARLPGSPHPIFLYAKQRYEMLTAAYDDLVEKPKATPN